MAALRKRRCLRNDASPSLRSVDPKRKGNHPPQTHHLFITQFFLLSFSSLLKRKTERGATRLLGVVNRKGLLLDHRRHHSKNDTATRYYRNDSDTQLSLSWFIPDFVTADGILSFSKRYPSSRKRYFSDGITCCSLILESLSVWAASTASATSSTWRSPRSNKSRIEGRVNAYS